MADGSIRVVEATMVFECGGKYYKMERQTNRIYIYANEAKFLADDPVGFLPATEFKKIADYIGKAMS